MLRRLFVVISSVTIGFMAGLVLTGRMRTAEVTSAAAGPESQATAQTRPAPAAAAPAGAAGPHRHRAARHQQRHQHLVDAGRTRRR